MPFVQVGGHRGGKKSTPIVYAEIDDDDVDRVSQYAWVKNTNSNPHTTYVYTRTGGQKLHLHRFILGLGDYKDDKRVVDHKDGNGLNNKKDNLVVCDTLYNSQSFRRHHGEANVGCVYFDTSMKRVKRWRGCVTLNGVKHQRRFLTEQEARDWITTTYTSRQSPDPLDRTPCLPS